jgi:N-acetyl sugar amidotransferase
MDDSIKSLKFTNGECHYCIEIIPKLEKLRAETKNNEAIIKLLSKISKNTNKYNCLIGVSGGVDSSYIVHLAHIYKLKPLLLHFDNGWNSELAVSNIKKLVEKTGFDLETYVVNWNEFKDIQKSFIKSGVVDIELVTDHAIFANLINSAKKKKIKYILSGTNLFTEHGMPSEWIWKKSDIKNILDIHKKYGTIEIKTYPKMNFFSWYIAKYLKFYPRLIEPLNAIDYRKTNAINELKDIYNWQEYEDKHFESFFTKFYQAYILPKKFSIDKRKSHLSCLIRNNELQRKDALKILKNNLYPGELDNDIEYFCKKLEFSREEFNKILASNPVKHTKFKNSEKIFNISKKIYKIIINK